MRRFSRGVVGNKVLDGARSIFTFHPLHKQQIEEARENSTRFALEHDQLKDAKDEFRMIPSTAGQQYKYEGRTIEVPVSPPSHHYQSEAVKHETHHAYQDVHAQRYFDLKYPLKSPDMRASMREHWNQDLVHRTTREISAIASGLHSDQQPVQVSEIKKKLEPYWSAPGYSGKIEDVFEALTNHPTHAASRDALDAMKLDYKTLGHEMYPKVVPQKKP